MQFKIYNENNPPTPPLLKGGKGELSNEKGIALIITLLVVTLLTALIVEFAYSARVNLSAAGNFRDKQKSYYLAKSGVNFIAGMLKDNASKSPKKVDDLNQMLPPVTVGDGIVTVKVFDESAKINIKSMDSKTSKAQARLLRLFEIKRIDAYLLEGISERGSYSLVSELRLVNGMTDEVYDKIKDYLTVYPVNDNININTADATVLRCLSSFISEDMAQRIISYREKNRFTNNNIKDLENVVGTTIYDDIKNYIVTESNDFSVISTGTVNDVDNTIEAVLKRSDRNITRLYWRNQ